MSKKLQNKTILVTGATSGIGLTAAKTLAANGACVLGVGRSEERNRAALAQIQKAHPSEAHDYFLADLSSQNDIRNLASALAQWMTEHGKRHLDALVNNAGVYLERKALTVDGIEKTFAVNHLAPFMLTCLCLPLLQKAEMPRVLTVSSYSHKTTWLSLNRIANPWPYVGLLAYKRSKLCNVLFTYELNRRVPGVTAFAVDPGLVNTDIASKGSQGISDWVWRRRRHSGTSPDVPSRTILTLISRPQIDTTQGFYFKDSAPKSPSRNAQRADLSGRLWALSNRLTGCDW